MFTKETIRDMDLSGQAVLLRADYNVPVEDGVITSGYRIEASVPTIQALQEMGVEKLVICSHLGRPKGPEDTEDSLLQVAERLGQLLGQEVKFASDCVGEEATKAVADLGKGEVLLLENLRFHPGEAKNDDDFAKLLAGLADVFVQDGFGVVHREAASTVAITSHLPSVAGLLLEKEVDTITRAMEQPQRPLMAIVGGAKIADKIGVLERFIETADFVAVSGAMANTFLAAQGVDVAASLYDEDLTIAKEIMAKAEAEAAKRSFAFVIPHDGVVSETSDGKSVVRVVGFDSHNIGDTSAYPQAQAVETGELKPTEMILDVGPSSSKFIVDAIKSAREGTILWNGTQGLSEVPAFAKATHELTQAMIEVSDRMLTIIGGGDTAAFVEEEEDKEEVAKLGHVSTGGGATLELIAGDRLPGVDALLDKK
jgi:phosphoglycerate kinase